MAKYKVKIAAPQGKVKGVTFNRETGGFRCPAPGGYQRQYVTLMGAGTWKQESGRYWMNTYERRDSKQTPIWGTTEYATC